MICSKMMMKMALVLILSLFIHGGKIVTGEPSANDIPDLTIPEKEEEPLLTEEELKDLNQLRKDVLTSLEDLRKNMESDEGKKAVNDIMEEVVKTMKRDSYEFTDANELQTHVFALSKVLETDLRDLKITLINENIDNESDNKKIEDFRKNTVPGLLERFKPFDEYKYFILN